MRRPRRRGSSRSRLWWLVINVDKVAQVELRVDCVGEVSRLRKRHWWWCAPRRRCGRGNDGGFRWNRSGRGVRVGVSQGLDGAQPSEAFAFALLVGQLELALALLGDSRVLIDILNIL